MSRAALRVTLLLLAALGRPGAGSEHDEEHGGQDAPSSREKGEQGVPAAGFGGPRGTGHPEARCTPVLGLGSLAPAHPDARGTPVLSLGSLMHGAP